MGELNLVANILIFFGAVIILLCSINFLKSKNAISCAHYAVLANIYGVTILLLGIAIKDYQLQTLLKILILITINLVVTVILNQIFNKSCYQDKKNIKGLKICKIDF